VLGEYILQFVELLALLLSDHWPEPGPELADREFRSLSYGHVYQRGQLDYRIIALGVKECKYIVWHLKFIGIYRAIFVARPESKHWQERLIIGRTYTSQLLLSFPLGLNSPTIDLKKADLVRTRFANLKGLIRM
jgi:hypothetical protein